MIVYGILSRLMRRNEQQKLEEQLKREKESEDIPDPFIRGCMHRRYHDNQPVTGCFFTTI